MKIAITGTTGIGKTTLAKALSAHFSLSYIEEDIFKVVYAKDALKNIPKDKTKEFNKGVERFLKTLDQWLTNRMRYFDSEEAFIEDRFCIDAIKYLGISGIGKFGDDLIKDLVVRCGQYSTTYDLVIVPPISDFSTFQYRNESGLYRNNALASKVIDQSIYVGLLEQFCAAPRVYLTPNLITTEQRLENVCQILNERKILR